MLYWVGSILLAFENFIVSKVVTWGSIQSISYALSFIIVSLSAEIFAETAMVLISVGFFFAVVFTVVIFIAAAATLV